jgi:hypothetical protein
MDVSHMKSRFEMAIIHEDNQMQWRLTDKFSIYRYITIYRAKALAILKVIKYIISEINHNNITIHSDSLSNLTSLQKFHYNARIVQNAQYRAQLSGNNIS